MDIRKKELQRVRHFSEEFKRSRVKEYESGKYTIQELCKLYNFSDTSLYNWLHKYSYYEQKSIIVVEEKESSKQKVTALQSKIKELEQIVGQKQIRIDFLEKMIEIADRELGVDLKKNCGTKP